VLGAVSIGLCFLFAGLAGLAGLAPIVGAFAAGLILDEVHVRPFGVDSMHKLEEFVSPIVAVFAPIFFVRTGMQVELGGVTGMTLLLAGALTVAGVGGKLLAGLGARGPGADRWAVGIGMIPRGEVGLIFADAGARLMTGGRPVIEPSIYSALVLMVMATTLAAPPWLARRIRSITPAPD
jgi:Kef-type K+ transport system membrane component KefB